MSTLEACIERHELIGKRVDVGVLSRYADVPTWVVTDWIQKHKRATEKAIRNKTELPKYIARRVPKTRGRNSKWVFETVLSAKRRILRQWQADAIRAMAYPIVAIAAIDRVHNSVDHPELNTLEAIARAIDELIR
jgi:hypothetical protein